MRFIPTRVHGILDYLYGLTFLLLPLFLEETARTQTVLMAVGAMVIIVSLMTRYELGAFRRLPMRGHLLLDTITGLGLLAYAYFSMQDPDATRGTIAFFGAFAIVTALCTQTESSVEHQPAHT